MLVLQGLTKHFKAVRAVQDVSLTVKPGEVFGLLGANGAGKTTTLRMLATMLTPTAGTASINGIDLIKKPDEIRKHVGLLFGGDTGLYERLTARENIVYFAELNDMSKAEANKRAEELAEAFNFTEYLSFRAKKLSKGTRQKAALARSVVHNPTVMLFDEPMVGLDVTSRKDVEDFVFELKGKDKTIVLSDHNLDVITRLCDRVGILHKGSLMACGTIEDLCNSSGCGSLEEVFFKLAGRGNEE
ncbi:MAG: ATP-binding cassette domain-containing protein [Oscillospiraceae bacterium]|jgi:sodium transport system ATP-binding protein|nr:ATP-binding cassette domain-containing protein [Oscillospiraceae bacterium]